MVLDQYIAVDLTHPLDQTAPTWSGGCGFHLETKMDYPEGLKVQSVKSHAGVGTHMDAPTHFIENSWCIAQIPLEHLIVPVYVLDVTEQATPDFSVGVEEILQFEKKHGSISKSSLFLANTGWSRFWKEPQKYRNQDEQGRMHFPGFSKEAALLLLERGVVGIGIDTLSPDGSINGKGAEYPVHRKILGAKKYILENLTNLSEMPAVGGVVIALPPKAVDATEFTARVVGLKKK